MREARRSQAGAVMVEFVLASFVFFAILGGILNLGLAFYRRLMLNHASIVTARHISTTPLLDQPCTAAAMRERAEQYAMKFMETVMLQGAEHGYRFSSSTVEPLGNSLLLRVRGEWTSGCVLCLFVDSIDISATSQAVLEHECGA